MRSHLGEPARLTGPAHFHLDSPLDKNIGDIIDLSRYVSFDDRL